MHRAKGTTAHLCASLEVEHLHCLEVPRSPQPLGHLQGLWCVCVTPACHMYHPCEWSARPLPNPVCSLLINTTPMTPPHRLPTSLTTAAAGLHSKKEASNPRSMHGEAWCKTKQDSKSTHQPHDRLLQRAHRAPIATIKHGNQQSTHQSHGCLMQRAHRAPVDHKHVGAVALEVGAAALQLTLPHHALGGQCTFVCVRACVCVCVRMCVFMCECV